MHVGAYSGDVGYDCAGFFLQEGEDVPLQPYRHPIDGDAAMGEASGIKEEILGDIAPVDVENMGPVLRGDPVFRLAEVEV